MARNTEGMPARGAGALTGWGIALGALLLAVTTALGQQGSAPSRPRDLLKAGIDSYKRGQYEKAAQHFAAAQNGAGELSRTEQQDLTIYGKQNGIALRNRREGAAQLAHAAEAMNAGQSAEAARLLKAANANQYLSPADRKAWAVLDQQLHSGKPAAAASPTAPDGRALLVAARKALERGDVDAAEQMAVQAEKAGGAPSWLRPWDDSPAKVRRDAQAARQKRVAPPVTQAPAAETKGSSWSLRNLFTRGNSADSQPAVPPPAFPGGGQATPPNPPTASADAAARELIHHGQRALQAGNLDMARQCALKAKQLPVRFGPREMSPDQLLSEVQRRAAAPANSSTPPIAARPTAPAKGNGDPRALVREARTLLEQRKLDECETRVNQAAAFRGVRWGLFEDTPDRVRRDLLHARATHDRAEAGRLLVQARKLYQQGQLDEATKLAYRAKTLHGPYSVLDFGDRPDALLQDVHQAKLRNQRGGPMPRKTNEDVLAHQGKPNPTPPNGSAIAQAEAHNRAVALVREARILEQQGRLVEALQKAHAARQLNAPFGPGEDSPAAVAQSLAALCNRQVQTLVQQATEKVTANVADPGRFQKANADLDAACQLARSFGQDTHLVEQKALWLQQIAATSGSTPPPLGQHPGALVQVGHQTASTDPEVQKRRQAGAEKLDKARLELRAGNFPLARKLAVEAFNPAYDIQKDAEVVIRTIDAEEHNQQRLAAGRTFDAGLDAFTRRDFVRARTIFAALDMPLLRPEQQARLREVMSLPEMQPIAQVAAKEGPGTPPGAGRTGTARVGDSPDDLLNNVRAMEEIQFQQFRERGLQAQRSAMELFKAGQKSRAVETLTAYLGVVSSSGLTPEKQALLRRAVEGRVQQYRTLIAQDMLAGKEKILRTSGKHNENDYQLSIQKDHEEVAKLMKDCNRLMKEGKFKDALACAQRVQEVDPENLAAQSATRIASVRMRQKLWDENKDRNEKFVFESTLVNDYGDYVTDRNPLTYGRDGGERLKRDRSSYKEGIWPKHRSSREKMIEQKLSQPITGVNFKDVPLQEALQQLSGLAGVDIVPNTAALSEMHINLEHPLSLTVGDVALKSALNLLLSQLKLTYVIQNDVLWVTTENDPNLKGQHKRVVYPVTDLVVPVENHATPDVFNMQKALERQIASQAASSMAQGMQQYTLPSSMPPGQPVGSYSQGLGGVPGQPQVASARASATPRRAPGETLHNELIELIKNTVAKSSWEDMGGQGSIQYFPLGMALVVNQTQEVQEEVQQLLAALRRLQDLEVAVEVRLMSISEGFFERMGVDFDVNLRTGTSRREVDLLNNQFVPFGFVNRNFDRLNITSGLTPAGTLTPDLNIPIRNSSFGFSVPPFGGYPGTIGNDGGLSLGLAFLSDVQVYMLLEAAQGDHRAQVMQAPKITVFNGQTATISVMQNIFFMTSITPVPLNGQVLFIPQNQPFPIGMTLQVTPVVSADRRFVRLNLFPQILSQPSPAIPLIPIQTLVPNFVQGVNGPVQVGQPQVYTIFLQQPVFDTINVNTTVNVPDGGTVLLGGMKTIAEARQEAGPPFLSKIPYINRLFKNVGYGREAQTLMIMVTPRIIINEEEEQIFLGLVPPVPRP